MPAFPGDARARARDRQERVRGIAQWKNEIDECRIGISAVLKRFGESQEEKEKRGRRRNSFLSWSSNTEGRSERAPLGSRARPNRLS
jgi:hypothetical protein